MSWTAEKIAVVKRHWGDKSASEIAEMIGSMSRNAVIGKAHRLGLTADIIAKGRQLNTKHRANIRSAARREQIKEGSSANIKPGFQSPRAPTCQWLEGEPRDRNFCAAAAKRGSSYCEAHYKRCIDGHWTPAREAA